MSRLQNVIRTCCETSHVQFLDRGYSGRGMMGSSCVAIAGSHQACQRVIAQIIMELSDSLLDDHETMVLEDTPDNTRAFELKRQEFYDDVDILVSHRIDNFGHDFVYYFQNLDFEEPAEADEGG
jgi:hypothetical protein